MRAFRVPEVLLLVGGENGAVIGDEVCDVLKVVGMFFYDGARDDADIEFFGERLIGFEVGLGLCA